MGLAQILSVMSQFFFFKYIYGLEGVVYLNRKLLIKGY